MKKNEIRLGNIFGATGGSFGCTTSPTRPRKYGVSSDGVIIGLYSARSLTSENMTRAEDEVRAYGTRCKTRVLLLHPLQSACQQGALQELCQVE